MSASASYIDGGVRFKKIAYDPGHWDFVDVAGDETAAMAWFIGHNGASYDLIGNLSFVFPLIPHSRRKWFCSEAIAAALGIPEPWRLGPNGLAAVLACTTTAGVAAVQWSPADVAVPSPCRATHATFLDALRELGEDVIPAILAAKDGNPALLQWWTYFDQAQYISGTDTRLAGGLHGLEFAGLLPEGGAAAVLARLTAPL